jgi:hypothetical protein
MTSSLLQLLDQKGRTLERMFAADIFLPGTVEEERDIFEELHKCLLPSKCGLEVTDI